MDLLLFFLVQSLPVISLNLLWRTMKGFHQPQTTMLTRMFRNPPTRMMDKRGIIRIWIRRCSSTSLPSRVWSNHWWPASWKTYRLWSTLMHRSAVTTASCCLPCSWMPIIISNPLPVIFVVKKLEWITHFFSLPWWRQDWTNVNTLYSIVMEVQPLVWPSRLSWRNSTSPTTDMWFVLNISSDMLVWSWRRTRRWVQRRMKGRMFTRNWRRTIGLACSLCWYQGSV